MRLKLNFTMMLIACHLLMTSSLVASGQTTDVETGSSEIAIAWFDLQLELIRETPGYTPPVAARAAGYTGVTLYEAVVHGMPEHQSLVGQLNDLDALPQPDASLTYDWAVVANYALYDITRNLYRTTSFDNLAAMDALYMRLAAPYQSALSAEVYDQSVAYGQTLAEAIFDWSMTDGGYEAYLTNFPSDYVMPGGDGMWELTPLLSGDDPLPALQPYWGDVRPFVLRSSDSCMVPPPPAYSLEPDSLFYREALEVYNVSQTLTDEQAEIAYFWADDPGGTATPPGHSISILTQVLIKEDASLGFAAGAYARLGMAVADAFIGCWEAKYRYNLVRPVTVLQELFDENWMPIVDTPPFPEYTSGHSVQSGAAEVILVELFGDDYDLTDTTHDNLGLARRSYSSFTEMFEEAAISRMYGGIHYMAAIDVGLDQGRCIGDQINAVQFLVEDK